VGSISDTKKSKAKSKEVPGSLIAKVNSKINYTTEENKEIKDVNKAKNKSLLSNIALKESKFKCYQ
jgi:hypothetical protein